jgi:hypothetical protein
MARRRQRYYSNPRYREPARYRYRRESCLERILRYMITTAIIILAALLIGFVLTHLSQTIQLIATIFAAISFLISIFPRILFIIGILAAVFAALATLYGLARLFAAISKQLSTASAESAKTRMLKAKAKQEKAKTQQADVQVKLAQRKLVHPTPSSDQRQPPIRRTRNLQDTPQVPQASQRQSYRTRNLQEQDASQAPQQQQQSVPPPPPVTIPHIAQLLGNAIQIGQTDMLHGFKITKNGLVVIRGELPHTAIIAGKSGSGKTRRVILMIFQALLIFHALGKGYRITVCDPHAEKPGGLLKLLAPFIPWLTVARSYPEMIAASRDHIDEMESRLTPQGSRNGEVLMPRLIIFEEFPKVMKSKMISRADKQIIAECVRESAVQYRDIGGFSWIIGQEWTQDAIFDTAIRKDAEAILCHQLSAEYAASLFPLETELQRLAQQIERRECIFKDADNHVHRTITATVPNEEIETMVAYLARSIPRQVPQRRTTKTIQQVPPPQQPGAFYMADTENLAPGERRPSATWQGPPAPPTQMPEPEVNRQQYGYPSRALHRNRLMPQAQQTTRTTENLAQVSQDADGSPDDTILVPEPPAPLQQQRRPQFLNPMSGKLPIVRPAAPAPIPPATNELVTRPETVEPPADVQQNQFSQLAQARKSKKLPK